MKKNIKKILVSCLVFVALILFVHIIIPKKSVLRCTSSLDKSFELVKDTNVEIDLAYKKVFLFFRKEDISEKLITVSFLPEKLTSAENFYYSKNLQEKYCNNEIKNDYSCQITRTSYNSYSIKVESTIPNLIGEKESMSRKEYKKILEDNGYVCK